LDLSDEEILENMMSSERGDSSHFDNLFLDETIPVEKIIDPPKIRRSKNLLFPKPVPVVIVAGQRRQPPRAAKSATTQAAELIKSDKLQKLLNKPMSKKASTASDVSSSYSKYNSLSSEVQHIRVDVIRVFEASLKWKIDLDCTLVPPCITPICDNRIKTIHDANTVDFGGHCSFIHCPGLPMEEVLQNFSRAYDKDHEHTSAILAVQESD
jgi:hypothetical protein